MFPSLFFTSSRTAFNLSSNSPLYLAPATRAPKSRANIFLSFSPSGTSPRTIRCANPSTAAVLPTPGSPINTGLFFVLRESILITFLISLSRPITGSSFNQILSILRQSIICAFRIIRCNFHITSNSLQRSKKSFSLNSILSK